MQLPVPLRKRKANTHKGSYGFVLVVGGSPGLTGAVCLCAQAALRIGAGLVKVGVAESLNSIFEIKLTEEMSLPLADKKGHLTAKAFKTIIKSLSKVDVLVVGPGAGADKGTVELILKIIKTIDKPLVIDADGLNALSSDLKILNNKNTKNIVLTPHPGEFSRLIKKDIQQIDKNRKGLAKEFALRYNLNLVLKGHQTIVTNGEKIFENDTGNPAMATAGTGDVLSGMIAGLIAQGIDIYEASKLGVYLHGLSGDLAAEEKTENCVIASDLLNYLPKAIKKVS
ncbi:MAG: NAD(P)H-hydrate dehydratase [Candidatus Omnitrophica bacterium]|nr:NAD(P)H-hydrate dehydratase [Candidatus Omnitrophota bacterium]